MSCDNNGFFGCGNDWIWIVIAVIVILCLFGDNGGFLGSRNECC